MSDEVGVPSLSAGNVGSRFVSEDDIASARNRREQEWNEAYARIGQEPPPRPVEDVFDGRSLAEKLAANKAAKQDEWEERNKLSNQFRALEEDEVNFLDAITDGQRKREREIDEEDDEGLKGFKEAVAAKQLTIVEQERVRPPMKPVVPALRKKPKTLRGVQVKRKMTSAKANLTATEPHGSDTEQEGVAKKRIRGAQ